MTEPDPGGNLTETVRNIAQAAGASLQSMEYEVRFPATASALRLPDGRAVKTRPAPNYPSLHLIPDSPAAAEFWAVITQYTDDGDDFVLLDENARDRNFTIQGHEQELKLRERSETRADEESGDLANLVALNLCA